MIIGIDHGYYAIKTRNCSFPAGITPCGSHEPYTRQNVLTFGGCFFVCGSGRQPIQRDKTANDNYYLLTLAAIAQELQARGAPRECSVTIAAGLPLTSYGREKPAFRKYLLRNVGQPTEFGYEGKKYRITIEDVLLFPQGFTALMTQPDLLVDEPSMLLLDIGGWTVDLMRIDNGRPIIGTCHSLEFGMIRCIDEVRERVRQNTGLSLTDAQIEQVLAGRPCSLEETVRGLISEQGRIYTELLLSAVLEAGFDYHALPVVMMGGGASVVSRHIRPSDGLCRTVTLLDDRINAQGYERAVAALWGDDAQGVNRPQFVFRPNLRDPAQRRAWKLLQHSLWESAARISPPASSRPVIWRPRKRNCAQCCGKNLAKSRSPQCPRNPRRRRRCQNQR